MSRRVPLERATSRRWPRAVAAEAGAEAVAEAGAGASDEAAAEAGERAAPPRPRIGGIDLARALAIVGMLAVHIGPTHLTDVAGRLYALPHGRASILFVLVAGIGVSLLAASRTRSLATARWRLAWRAALLLPLGLLLQDLDHRVFVILPTYAALFLVAILALRLPDRALLALACALALLGPVAVLLGSTAYPEGFARRAAAWSDPASVPYRVFAGPFPLPVWSAPFLLGMWLGRRDLRSQATRIALVLGGAATAALAPAAASLLAGVVAEAASPSAWHALLIAKPHSQMPPWLIGSMGSAALVLGCSLAWADALPRIVAPLVAMGRLALTVYVAHLLALHAWSPALRSGDVAGAVGTVVAFTAVAALAATLWRRAFRLGPLEALLDVPYRLTGGRRPRAGGRD
jgi:uncharacterized membrane protein YeiB